MGRIPPDKSLDEIDREVLDLWRTRRSSGLSSYTSDRVERLLLELENRLTKAGAADPDIARELLAELRKEARQ